MQYTQCTQILVHSWGPRMTISVLFHTQTKLEFSFVSGRGLGVAAIIKFYPHLSLHINKTNYHTFPYPQNKGKYNNKFCYYLNQRRRISERIDIHDTVQRDG